MRHKIEKTDWLIHQIVILMSRWNCYKVICDTEIENEIMILAHW